MKTILFSLFCLFISSTVFANAIDSVRCEPGGEYGNNLYIKLSRDYEYGKMTIKRKNASKDYTRDLSTFKGGTYRLDLASRGGVQWFACGV